MKNTSIIIFLLFWLSNVVFGQIQSEILLKDSSLKIGIIDKINSIELGESRVLNIYLPEGYSQSASTTYPVIYLLDGSINEDFIHIVGVVQFLTMLQKMPESIVVGIVNIDRKRDFTFPTTIEKDKKKYPTTGKSSQFINFIEKELQPYIEKKYKVNSTKTIIGQSLGGLLATEILLKKPLLFDNYIIVSPSLWWDNESLLAFASGFSGKQVQKNTMVYVSVGTEGEQMEKDAKKLSEMLKSKATRNLNITFDFFPKENHATILHNSVYSALETLNK